MGWFKTDAERHSENLQNAHNDGQTDASNGRHTPPGYIAGFMSGMSTAEQTTELRDAYESGQINHRESQKSGCFLTTACTQAAGLPDDCHELTVLRGFRDTYVRGLPTGETLIREYYELSPQIVPKLSDEELRSIYVAVQLAVAQISRGEFREAFTTYAALFGGLRDKYLAVAE